MAKPAPASYRRPDTPSPAAAVPFVERFVGRLLLLLLGVTLLSLAFAPVKQFYLAWVGLVPWLLVVRSTRSPWRAFAWSWLAGVLFFSANMWWLAGVTGPGSIALMVILGLYWAFAGVLVRGVLKFGEGRALRTEDGQAGVPPAPRSSALHPLFSVLAIPVVWVAFEWLRGTWPFEGLPWLYLGHTQTPFLHGCQVADFAGELGVSFWVALVNALVAALVLSRRHFRGLVPAVAVVAAVLAGVVGYGFYRFAQEAAVTSPGPVVLVVQPNIPQRNDGEKGLPVGEIVAFHQRYTERALSENRGVHLVVWSETMMPPINPQAREYFRGSPGGDSWEKTHRYIESLAGRSGAAFLVGGMYWDRIEQLSPDPGDFRVGDSRNAAYYYDRHGDAGLDYHKVHLVPFGEYIPFKETVPWLYKLILSFGPRDSSGRNVMEDYQLTRGDASRLTAFPLPALGSASDTRVWHFVVPICFEDIDANLVARMFRGPGGTKRADFIVNITNDGWFKFNEQPQHFQAAQFRSIENRAPTARSVNTGISGFIDSMGRPHDLIGTRNEGTRAAAVRIDARVAPFTRYGNVFAWACAGTTALIAAAGCVRWVLKHKRAKATEG